MTLRFNLQMIIDPISIRRNRHGDVSVTGSFACIRWLVVLSLDGNGIKGTKNYY